MFINVETVSHKLQVSLIKTHYKAKGLIIWQIYWVQVVMTG